MKNLSSLTRKITLGALSAIYGNSVQGNTGTIIDPINSVDTDQVDKSAFPLTNFDLKLRLKPSLNTDNWEFFAHRSHRSHSSHRSHQSHYSSRTNDTYTPANNSGTGTSSGSSTTYPNSYSSHSTSTSSTYKLGSRALKLGMEGEDVTELINLLISKGYYKLPENHILKEKELFDIIVEDAVKKFQIDKDINVDGTVGPTTLYHLKY